MRQYAIVLLISIMLAQTGCAQTTAVTAAQTTTAQATEAVTEAITETVTEATTGEAPATVSADGTSAPVEASSPPAGDSATVKDGYAFSYNGQSVYLGDEMTNVLGILGQENEYYTAPSCAFDGDAKMYVYGGFELATYIRNETDSDKLYSITLFDDSVATAEEVYIGSSYDDMVAAYGEGYEEIPGGSYLYSKDGAVLSFTVTDGAISAIQYYIEDIYV